jgi:hypothetical protein
MAKHWLPTYNGTKIVKGYKKKFSVDTTTALRELQELGVQFTPEYISAVEAGEKSRVAQLQDRKRERLAKQYGLESQYDERDIWDDIRDRDLSDSINIMDKHRLNFENRIGSVRRAGKNHVRVSGTLLQTNKKWTQLKQKQRDWIYEITSSEHRRFLKEYNRLPMKTGRAKLIGVIVAKVDERGIWLPMHELESGIGKYIDRMNRRADMSVK